MRYQFVARHRGIWPTRLMCSTLAVSRAGFYAWLQQPESARAQQDLQLTAQIRNSFALSDSTYGSPRMLRDLRAWGYRCSRNRAEHPGS